MDVPEKWTGKSGHVLHDRRIPPWFRESLADLIAKAEKADPPGLASTRRAFLRQGQVSGTRGQSPGQSWEAAVSQLLELRFELLVGVRLIGATALTKISSETPDFECTAQGSEFGIEATTRARPEVGAAMHRLLDEGLSGTPVSVMLIRSGELVFGKAPEVLKAIAVRVIADIRELVAAAAGGLPRGTVPIPELGLAAVLHGPGPLTGPGTRVASQLVLDGELRDYQWKRAALQIKDPIENKGSKSYGLPSIVVLDVSRLDSAGWEPAEPSWTEEFQKVLDRCDLGSLEGALVVRSDLKSGHLEPLCWRLGEPSAELAASTLLGYCLP